MFTVAILAAQTASAVYNGTADQGWMKSFVKGALEKPWVQKVIMSAQQAISAITDAATRAWNFLTQWFRDDPVGATAGVVAGVLTLGVLIVVGGQIAAFVGGLGLIGKIKLLIGAGLALVSLGGVLRHIVRGVSYIWNFNFNITDAEIARQQAAALDGVYALAGDALGTLLGSVVCGTSVAAGVGLVRLDIAAAAKVIKVLATDEDIREEITSRFHVLISGAGRAVANIAFLEIYKNARKWIKSSARDGLLKAILPGSWQKVIQAWGEEGSQAWSINGAIEDAIESISDSKIRNFLEAGYEAFTDACTETTITLSNYRL